MITNKQIQAIETNEVSIFDDIQFSVFVNEQPISFTTKDGRTITQKGSKYIEIRK